MHFWDIPSAWWQASTVAMGIGVAIAVIGALTLLAAASSFLPHILKTPKHTRALGSLQLLAESFQTAGASARLPVGNAETRVSLATSRELGEPVKGQGIPNGERRRLKENRAVDRGSQTRFARIAVNRNEARITGWISRRLLRVAEMPGMPGIPAVPATAPEPRKNARLADDPLENDEDPSVMICGGLVMYPIGWDNREVRESCGKGANVYNLGEYGKVELSPRFRVL
ncbi:hypothetical protein K0M31_015562 [Melipona bicolor]|uniref:Uncharacterized protein n=1 Tax=Melipona bicolor TaxID=60889 RepID=A0AA40FF67_9HYME|nr:hypothetical protein K0M31_015562 [Melipona bicolor]